MIVVLICIVLLALLVAVIISMFDVVITLTFTVEEVGLSVDIVAAVTALVVKVLSLPGGVVIITTPASPLPIELVATTENV